MLMTVSPIPEGYHSVTPYLIVNGASDAIDFYGRAFGAEETMRLPGPGGKVMHAEFKIGDSMIMIADEFPERGIQGPKSLGGSPVGICLYVENVDVQYEKAVAAGATVTRPIQDQFYGDRSVTVEDPFGHQWTLATHVEDVSGKEIERRMAEFMCED
jgi:PhnB protein